MLGEWSFFQPLSMGMIYQSALLTENLWVEGVFRPWVQLNRKTGSVDVIKEGYLDDHPNHPPYILDPTTNEMIVKPDVLLYKAPWTLLMPNGLTHQSRHTFLNLLTQEHIIVETQIDPSTGKACVILPITKEMRYDHFAAVDSYTDLNVARSRAIAKYKHKIK